MASSYAAEPLRDPMRTVLLVHSNADGRAMYRLMLEGLPYAIEECEDGAEALGKAIIAKPDLMIVSARLARIDGLALCRLLRSDPETHSIGIVLLTTSGHSVDLVRAKAAGADAALEVPCTAEAIVQALRDVSERPRRDPIWAQPSSVAEQPADAEVRRRPRARTFRREQTTTPPLAPPALHCPSCQSLLVYQHSQTGGVNDRAFEQWDYFRCQACGPYQYRHRTRKLRST
jgi:CheY-like chemotaxis protein